MQNQPFTAQKSTMTILPKLKKIDCLEMAGLVSKINHTIEWVVSLFIVKRKEGSLRLCLDPKDLIILRDFKKYNPLKKFHVNCMIKSILQFYMRDCYWHILLDPESPQLYTFNTPFGTYKFNWPPFGTCYASGCTIYY